MKTDIELAEAAGFELLMDGRISHMAIEKGDCDQEVRALIRLMREELVAVVAAERERCAKLLTQSASLAWSEGVAAERERCVRIIEAHQVPVGNSAAGEMAAEWTMDALREVRDAIRGA